MTVFTTIVNPADIRDNRYHNPCKLSPAIQYQVPPTAYFTLFHTQQHMNDLLTLPSETHARSVLSLVISNTSLVSYKKSSHMKQHFDILFENSKMERLDVDFTQFKFNDGVLTRVLALVNHVQKHHEYNVFVSLTIPVDKNYKIPDEFINLIARLHSEFISFNMINILITKELKQRHLSWFDTVVQTFVNVSQQLRDYDSNNEIFIGSISKYIGFTFDCDLIPESSSSHPSLRLHKASSSSLLRQSVKTTVKQSVIHGERKNMLEQELLKIWHWATHSNIGQIQIKSYLANSKNIKKVIERNLHVFRNGHALKLPKNFMFDLADEVGICNVLTSNFAGSNSRNSSSSTGSSESSSPEPLSPAMTAIPDTIRSLPDYDTAMYDKIVEYEHQMNTLIRLPSYRTIAET